MLDSLPRPQAWRQLATAAIVIAGLLFMFATLQRQLIYFPSKARADALSQQAARMGLQAWLDDGGEAIGWRSGQARKAGNRMLVFHGNAGFALDRHYYLAGLQALEDEWEVFLFEYPGYGAREGMPSEAGFRTAALAALRSLLAADARPVFLLGESLGSGVASALAAKLPDRIAGLLLVTPFSSLVDVAAHHYPLLPVRMLLSERYDSVEALSHFSGPVAFLLAGRDEIVTAELGRRLYDSYSGPKWLRVEPRAGHNTLPIERSALWWREASAFLTSPH